MGQGGRHNLTDIPHEFKGYAEMISEVEVLDHVNDVVLIVSVLEKHIRRVITEPYRDFRWFKRQLTLFRNESSILTSTNAW